MPIFQQDIERNLERRESAKGDDRAGHRSGSGSVGVLSMMPSIPDHSGAGAHDYSQGLPRPLSRRISEESIRTELCEGPVLDTIPRPSFAQTPDDNLDDPCENKDNNPSPTTCTDRADLIERLKRGESPTWVPHRHLFDSTWTQQSPRVSPTQTPTRKDTTTTATTSPPTLLPPPTITPEKDRARSDEERRYQDGIQIERPRSALHSGDFTNDEASPSVSASRHQPNAGMGQESTSYQSWVATSPPRSFTPLKFERQQPPSVRSDAVRSALSCLSSSSTSFAYQPPTSPLFQSESNDDVDLISPIDATDLACSIPRQQRRHTVLSALPSSYGYSPSPLQRQSPLFRQERTYPYQAHQPRRSLTAAPGFSVSGSSPQTPAFLQSRRPSIGSDVSPLQHASMVGSYEESILRGRMSTTPSKPLDFSAQIGVLGLGKCKSNLRCPSHVTLPFPAVFYRYGSSSHGRTVEDDGPSPYVGQIDLENGLPNQEDEARLKKKQQCRASERRAVEADAMDAGHTDVNPPLRDAHKSQRAKRRSELPRAPPGGSYRIPEKGQIQIIIKNSNKTAVKLFLVPYDLAGMEPGTKTFVRQRSYSNGPIIDSVPGLKGDPLAERPILRYLVHLHICCPSKGRYYLYKSIRVVFANRVPDGKERLQNEITLPEPRFTPYKAIRVMLPPSSQGTGPGASLTTDTASRRRSSGIHFGGTGRAFDAAEGFASPSPSGYSFPYDSGGGHLSVQPIPFISKLKAMPKPMRDECGIPRPQSLESSQASRPTTQDSSNASNWSGHDGPLDQYNKLSKGDIGYGGNAFAGLINGNPAVAESLLSQRLKSLGVQRSAQETQESPDSKIEGSQVSESSGASSR